MENELNLSMEDCCRHYRVESSFVQSLNEHGLINLVSHNQTWYINYGQLSDFEKYMHLHFDMDINFEGMEAISHLLQKIETLQTELRMLKNRLPD